VINKNVKTLVKYLIGIKVPPWNSTKMLLFSTLSEAISVPY